MAILETIHGHGDLEKLSPQQLDTLCGEIRQFLITNISQTGGHLASNLGIVELTVALETVYNTETDRLVFDVGHQSYVHKLLTGRQADFAHLRQLGGIAGFPKPSESDTDAFVAGHASSSVSIALGMARARTLQGKPYSVCAVIGDGATTGGMAYEGLNDAGDSGEPMVVILNDNEMSIDRNVGGMAQHFSRLRSKAKYLYIKERYCSFLNKIPGGRFIYRITSMMKNAFKRVVLKGTMFEHMGFTYIGPVDGHDLPELIALLRTARNLNRTVLIHVMTQKGRGYKFAEEMPSKFHGVGKFDVDSGETLGKGSTTFSETFGQTLVRLAEQDSRICAITAAMPGGTGLLSFLEQYPNRLFDVGIAEEHAVSMAGGLAKQGMTPVVAVYSTFLQRSYDQILQDICMLKLHVVFAVDRAGLVGEDGETHHGVFDVGFLRQAPGMKILCPASCQELSQMLSWAVRDYDGPIAVRYPRGGDRGYTDSAWAENQHIYCHCQGNDGVILTYGTMINNVLQAHARLQEKGLRYTVLRLLSLDMVSEEIARYLVKDKPVFVVEETASSTGIHQEIAYQFPGYTVHAMDLGKEYVTHGAVDKLYQLHGLDGDSIARRILEEAEHEN